MRHKWLIVYLAHWYAWATSGVLLSLQHPTHTWLADLPWAYWGTDIGQALAGGDAASGGAWWILMGVVLTLVGAIASVVISLLWLAARDEPAQADWKSLPTPSPQGPREADFDESAREAARLVEDPRLRSLIQQLHTRLG
jgi:hypothetical protein